MAGRRPTLRNVAAAAGVSHMTVSRVVRGGAGVSAVLRKRVGEAITRLGYRPDPVLSALAAYRTRTGGGAGSVLVFLVCDRDAFSGEVEAGAAAEAERLGYRLEGIPLPTARASRARLGRTLFHCGVRGLLIGPAQDVRDVTGWDWAEFAPVSLGALAHDPTMDSVAMDYFDGMALALDYLRGRGCRRIGMAVAPELDARTGHRWKGAYLALGGQAFPLGGEFLGSASALRRWRRSHGLDGILTIHSWVWEALAAEAEVVFLNAFDCPPEAARVTLNPRVIGREGVRMVHTHILNREFGLPAQSRTVALRGRFEVGAGCH